MPCTRARRCTRSFLELLAHYRIEAVADVRRFPGSRRHPQYAQAALGAMLAEHGIAYRWLPTLGGRRRPLPDSPNIVWRNASFRGYADHIGSAEFSHGVDELLELSGHLRTTLLCAEAMWWRCHRAMIADVLRVRGIEVVPTDRLNIWKKQRCGWRTLRETACNVLKLARCANAPRKIRTRSFATQPSVVFHAFSIGKT